MNRPQARIAGYLISNDIDLCATSVIFNQGAAGLFVIACHHTAQHDAEVGFRKIFSLLQCHFRFRRSGSEELDGGQADVRLLLAGRLCHRCGPGRLAGLVLLFPGPELVPLPPEGANHGDRQHGCSQKGRSGGKRGECRHVHTYPRSCEASELLRASVRINSAVKTPLMTL